MKVQAISPQMFTSSPADRTMEEEMQIRRQALNTAIEKGRKRSRNIERTFWSIPVIAAVSAGILSGKTATFLQKGVTGNAAKVANAVKEGAKWSMYLGAASGFALLNAGLEKKSKGYQNFRQNHPTISMFSDFAAWAAACLTIPMVAKAGYAKLSPQHISKIRTGIDNISGHLNSIKLPKMLSSVKNYVSQNSPKWLKDTATVTVAYAPTITLLGGIFSMFGNRAKVSRDFVKEYQKLSNEHDC